MGTHISKVKSLTMDTWAKEQVEVMRNTGNVKSNAHYNPDETRHPPPTNMIDSERDSDLEKYIRSKYEFKSFISRSAQVAAIMGPSRSASSKLLSTTPPARAQTAPVQNPPPVESTPNIPPPVPPKVPSSTTPSPASAVSPSVSGSQSQFRSASQPVPSSTLYTQPQQPFAAQAQPQLAPTNNTWNNLVSLQSPSTNTSSLPLQYTSSLPSASTSQPIQISANPAGTHLSPTMNPYSSLSASPSSPFPSSLATNQTTGSSPGGVGRSMSLNTGLNLSGTSVGTNSSISHSPFATAPTGLGFAPMGMPQTNTMPSSNPFAAQSHPTGTGGSIGGGPGVGYMGSSYNMQPQQPSLAPFTTNSFQQQQHQQHQQQQFQQQQFQQQQFQQQQFQQQHLQQQQLQQQLQPSPFGQQASFQPQPSPSPMFQTQALPHTHMQMQMPTGTNPFLLQQQAQVHTPFGQPQATPPPQAFTGGNPFAGWQGQQSGFAGHQWSVESNCVYHFGVDIEDLLLVVILCAFDNWPAWYRGFFAVVESSSGGCPLTGLGELSVPPRFATRASVEYADRPLEAAALVAACLETGWGHREHGMTSCRSRLGVPLCAMHARNDCLVPNDEARSLEWLSCGFGIRYCELVLWPSVLARASSDLVNTASRRFFKGIHNWSKLSRPFRCDHDIAFADVLVQDTLIGQQIIVVFSAARDETKGRSPLFLQRFQTQLHDVPWLGPLLVLHSRSSPLQLLAMTEARPIIQSRSKAGLQDSTPKLLTLTNPTGEMVMSRYYNRIRKRLTAIAAAANLKDADPGDDSDSESVYGSANSSQQTLSTSSINFDSRSELFGSWSEEIGALPQDGTTRPLLDAVNQVRLLSDEASRNSRRIIEEHSKLAGMMAARLEEAKRTGVLGRNDDITSTGEGICQSSAALCTKMQCLRDRLQNLSQVIEDIQRRNSKQHVSWWGRICRWIPNVLRAVKSIFTTIKKALRNLRGSPLPPSDVAEIVKRYDAYDTARFMRVISSGNIEETQQLSNLRHFLEELSAKILQVEDNLQEIQTGQSSLHLFVEAETSQLIIDGSGRDCRNRHIDAGASPSGKGKGKALSSEHLTSVDLGIDADEEEQEQAIARHRQEIRGIGSSGSETSAIKERKWARIEAEARIVGNAAARYHQDGIKDAILECRVHVVVCIRTPDSNGLDVGQLLQLEGNPQKTSERPQSLVCSPGLTMKPGPVAKSAAQSRALGPSRALNNTTGSLLSPMKVLMGQGTAIYTKVDVGNLVEGDKPAEELRLHGVVLINADKWLSSLTLFYDLGEAMDIAAPRIANIVNSISAHSIHHFSFKFRCSLDPMWTIANKAENDIAQMGPLVQGLMARDVFDSLEHVDVYLLWYINEAISPSDIARFLKAADEAMMKTNWHERGILKVMHEIEMYKPPANTSDTSEISITGWWGLARQLER
ncbi:predicted protein [Postia placenta Mad-698-R]|nr:predicted protein [Postia placenta Mad-698-R]